MSFYEDICDEQELISMSEEISKREIIFTQHDVENEKLRKRENETLRKEKKLEKITYLKMLKLKNQ